MTHWSLRGGAFSTQNKGLHPSPATRPVLSLSLWTPLGGGEAGAGCSPASSSQQGLQARPAPSSAPAAAPAGATPARGSLPSRASLGTARLLPLRAARSVLGRTSGTPAVPGAEPAEPRDRTPGPNPGAEPPPAVPPPGRPQRRSPGALTALAAASGPHHRRHRAGGAGTHQVPAGEGRAERRGRPSESGTARQRGLGPRWAKLRFHKFIEL